MALISFLALEWHDSILEYLQQGGGETSNTPSYQQVSQPLHTRLIAQASALRLRTSGARPESYELWDNQASAKRSLESSLRSVSF